MIGYFDAAGSTTLPFNPANPYVKFRMNIFSNTVSILPKETGNFVGDVFSSDTTAGTFSYFLTGSKLTSSVATDTPKPIYRLEYTLANPLTFRPANTGSAMTLRCALSRAPRRPRRA